MNSIVLFLEQLYTQKPKITTPSLGLNSIRNPGHNPSHERDLQSIRTNKEFTKHIVKRDTELVDKKVNIPII